jgi:TRAP-type mannitol/chloroaromatic compound transport system substrate-binding protein
MKRRQFLAAAAVVPALAIPAPALSSGRRILKMVTAWPRSAAGPWTAAERLAKRITAMTDGGLTIEVYGAGDMVPGPESFGAVSGGVADLYHGTEHFWRGKSSAFDFFAAVPLGLTAGEMNAWIDHGGGQGLWDELAADFNIKPFMAGNAGARMGGWFNVEINSVEDFHGLKIHMPGVGGDILARFGAKPSVPAGGDVSAALRSGELDAALGSGPWIDLGQGLFEATKRLYYPGFHDSGSVLSAGINLNIWNSLDDAQQQIVSAAMSAETLVSRAEFDARNAGALETLRSVHGVGLKKFHGPILQAIGEASGHLLAEAAAEDALAKKVFDSFLGFRKNALAWSKYSQQAFLDARLLPFTYGE